MAAVFDDKVRVRTAAPWVDPPLPPLGVPLGSNGKHSQGAIRLILLALVIGVALELCGPGWAQAIFRAVRMESYRELAVCFAAFAAAVILHEGGHLVAAMLLKFEIVGGSLGPFRISRFHGQWSMQFCTRTPLSGSVSAIPNANAPWRTGLLIVVGAGPISTLLTGAAAAFLFLRCAPNNLAGEFFGCLAQLSFFLFVLGLIPSGANSPARSDADFFQSLLCRTPEAQDILLYHNIMQLRIEGFRPRYYPEKLIRAIAKLRIRIDMSLLFAQTIAAWALDRGDVHSAHAWNQRAAELSANCDVRLRNQALAESACLDIVIRDDRFGAGAKLADIDFKVLSPPWLLHRAKASSALAKGNIFEALGEICRSEYSLPNHMPYYDYQRMLLARLRQQARTLSAREIPAHPIPRRPD